METFVVNLFVKASALGVSPTFRTTYNGISFWWKILLHPSSRVALRLVKTEKGFEDYVVKVRFAFYSFKKSSGCYGNATYRAVGFALRKRSDLVRQTWSCDFAIRRRSADRLPTQLKIFPKNGIKILCKIMIGRENFDKLGNKTIDLRISPLSTLTENLFGKLSEYANSAADDDDSLADVTLVSADGKKFRCHRYVLYANSDVFRTMFSNENFVENSTRLVEIGDVDGETLTEVLRFIYTRKLPPVNRVFGRKLAVKCLYAAEKYNLEDLKAYCVAVMEFKLNQNNVLEYLNLADKYRLESLRALCVGLLINCIEWIPYGDWLAFCQECPALVGGVFKTLCLKCDEEDLSNRKVCQLSFFDCPGGLSANFF